MVPAAKGTQNELYTVTFSFIISHTDRSMINAVSCQFITFNILPRICDYRELKEKLPFSLSPSPVPSITKQMDRPLARHINDLRYSKNVDLI